MNLLLSSNNNALGIGYMTETKKEYDDLVEFYRRYLPESNIKDNVSKPKYSPNELTQAIKLNLKKCGYSWAKSYFIKEGTMNINTRNNIYSAFLFTDGDKSVLRISAILTQDEYEKAKHNFSNLKQATDMKVELTHGGEKYYNTLWGTSYSSFPFTHLKDTPSNFLEVVSDQICQFVLAIEDYKRQMNPYYN